MYECETWATTKYLLSRLDAFNTWALRKILKIPYTRHVSNAEVRRTTGCSPLSHLVTNRRLRLFCHIVCSSPREDHHRALAVGRPSHTWLRAIEADLGPLNFGLAMAWRKATTRDDWRHIVDTATLQQSTLWKKKKKKDAMQKCGLCCLSRLYVVLKRVTISSNFLHRWVATPLWFFRTNLIAIFRCGPHDGVSNADGVWKKHDFWPISSLYLWSDTR